MISSGKEIVGNNVGVNDGSGVSVKMDEGTGVFVGMAVLVTFTVEVGAGIAAEQLASVPTLNMIRIDK
jgi:hypothetical protein